MKIDLQAAKAMLELLVAGASEHGDALDYGVSIQSGGGPGFFMMVFVGKSEAVRILGRSVTDLVAEELAKAGIKQVEYPTPDSKKVSDEVLLRMLRDSMGGPT